jgi:hypothetical protein
MRGPDIEFHIPSCVGVLELAKNDLQQALDLFALNTLAQILR